MSVVSASMTLLTQAVLGAVACSQCGCSDNAVKPANDATGTCPAGDRARTASVIPGLLRAVPDLTGDGRDDYLVHTTDSIDVMAGPVPGTRQFRLVTDQVYLVTVATGDLDGDGDRDLVLATPWRSEVAVFFAPLASGATVSMSDADLLLRDPPDGLSNRFGLGVLVADVSGDGQPDLVVGAAAEGEEACVGTGDTAIFAGPLSPGRRTADDATFRIPAETTRCLGYPIVAGPRLGDPPRASLLLGGRNEAVWFDLPLSTLPSIVDRRGGVYFAGATDLDRDERTDLVFQDSIQYGDGRTVPFLAVPGGVTQVYEAVEWTTAGTDIIVETQSPAGRQFHRLVDGIADPQGLPVIAAAGGSGGKWPWSSTGDLDDDGLTDLILTDNLVRCASN